MPIDYYPVHNPFRKVKLCPRFLKSCLEFKKKCEQSKEKVTEILKKIKSEGKEIGGYAATSKSTTILNYCNIDKNLINFIIKIIRK